MGNKSLFVICDAQYLPFKSEIFDTISCLGSLEHYLDPFLALIEARRTLRKNGRYLVSVTNRRRWTGLFRFLSGSFKQPIEKPLDLSETTKLLNNSNLFVIKIVKEHQFDFTNYIALPRVFGLLLNKIDRIMPLSSNIEPLYITRKINN